jgi:hypothetical protein
VSCGRATSAPSNGVWTWEYRDPLRAQPIAALWDRRKG